MIDLSDKKVPEKNVPFELCIQKMLDEDFPLKFIKFYSVSLALISLSAFIFQILSIVYSTSFYYYGTG